MVGIPVLQPIQEGYCYQPTHGWSLCDTTDSRSLLLSTLSWLVTLCYNRFKKFIVIKLLVVGLPVLQPIQKGYCQKWLY